MKLEGKIPKLVIKEAVKNGACSAGLLRARSGWRNLSVSDREFLANTTRNKELLTALAKDLYGYVRSSVAMSHETPARVLRRLLKDDYVYARDYACAELIRRGLKP